MATYNANGVRNRMDVLLSLVEKGVDIICVQESHLRREEAVPMLPGFVVFRAEDVGEVKRGLITYVKKPISDYVYVSKRKGGSELWLMCKGFPFSETNPGLIMNVHWPTMGDSEMRKVVRNLAKQARKYQLLLMGDFNIHPPPGMIWEECWLGDETSKLGKVVQAAGGALDMYSSNHVTHLDLRAMSTLDYVVSPKEWTTRGEGAEVLIDLQGADHLPVMDSWSLEAPNLRGRPMRLSAEEVTQVTEAALLTLRNYAGSSIEEVVEVITKEIQEARVEKKGRRNRTFWCSNTTIQFWRRRYKHAALEFHKGDRKDGLAKERWLLARKRLRIVVADARHEAWMKHIEKMAVMSKVDPRSFFWNCRAIGGGRKRQSTSVRIVNENGELAGKREIVTGILGHLHTVWSPRKEHSEVFIRTLEVQVEEWQRSANGSVLASLAEWGELLDPITEVEIGEAVSGMKASTSPGTDDIPMQLWKKLLMSKNMREAVARSFSEIQETGKVPRAWLEVKCILIPKTDKPSTPKDYRGIMITQVVYRIFMKILQKRLRNLLEQKRLLQSEQAGFRKKRNTIDQVTTLMEILERRKGVKMQTSLIFVDIKQAYDSVHPQALRAALTMLGLPHRYVLLMGELYRESIVKIRIDGVDYELLATCGLRQGCPMAPLLFILLINLLIKKLREGPRLEIPGIKREQWEHNAGNVLNSLWFADDGVLLANNEIGCQELLRLLEQWTKEWGLQVNAGKCAGMKVVSGKHGLRRKLECNGQEIPEVTEFVYLGCLVNNRASRVAMAVHRLKETAKVVKWVGALLRRIWWAPMDVRIRATRAIVEGTCLYGAEVWSFGQSEQRLEQVIGRLGRDLWGGPKTGNLKVMAMEAGLTNCSLVIMIKRLQLMYRIIVNKQSPLMLLGKTNEQTKCLLWDMMDNTRKLDIPLALELRLVRRTYNHAEWKTIETNWITTRGQVLPSTERYMENFWGQDSFQGVEGPTLARRLYHQLRMDAFFDWRRIGWCTGSRSGDACGWCNRGVRESRSHLLLQCEAWKQVRRRFLGSAIDRLKRNKFNEEETVIVLLGGRAREQALDKETGERVLLFLEVIRRVREQAIKRMRRNK